MNVSFLSLLFFCGCATTSLQKNIEDYSEVRNEFINNGCGAGFIKGLYSGIIQIGGIQYHQYQFSDILAESPGTQNRLLEILSPVQGSEKVLIHSSYKKQKEISPAYLMCYEQVVHSRQMIAEFDKNDMSNAVHTMFIEVLASEVMVYRVWSLNRDTGEAMRTQVSSDTQIDWHIRNRTKYLLMHGGYIFSIPLDIVSFPYQFLLKIY